MPSMRLPLPRRWPVPALLHSLLSTSLLFSIFLTVCLSLPRAAVLGQNDADDDGLDATADVYGRAVYLVELEPNEEGYGKRLVSTEFYGCLYNADDNITVPTLPIESSSSASSSSESGFPDDAVSRLAGRGGRGLPGANALAPYAAGSGSGSGSGSVSGGNSSDSGDDESPGVRWCREQLVLTRVRQRVLWSTVAPVGVLRANTSAALNASFGGALSVCALYHCDASDADGAADSSASGSGAGALSGESGDGSDAVAVYGGLGVTTPCCGSRNGSFILQPSESYIVQLNALPLAAIVNISQEALTSAVCGGGLCCSVPHSACVVRLLDVRFLAPGVVTGGVGDGGWMLPDVSPSLCGHSLANVFDYDSGALLRRGYGAVLTTTRYADDVLLPKTLIRGVVAWLAAAPGDTGRRLQCEWRTDPSVTPDAYRSGEYAYCPLAAALGSSVSLPPLTLTVDAGGCLTPAETLNATTPECAISVDLNRLVRREPAAAGGALALRLYSSGELTAASVLREPLIVIGVAALRGATYAPTRSLRVSPASDYWRQGRGYLVVVAANEAASVEQTDSNVATCGAAVSCAVGQIFYDSMNRCGTVGCASIFGFSYNKETMACEARAVPILLFAILFVLIIALDVVLLLLRRRTADAQKDHDERMELFLRKTN